MKRKMILLLALLLIAVMCMTLASCDKLQDNPADSSADSSVDSSADSLEFTLLPDGTYEVSARRGWGFERPTIESITIPKTYEGVAVTSIGFCAFSGCTNLKSITIPDSVTSIGESAFSGCTALASITIPDSVASIGSSAFYNCTGLTSITIPDSVTSIGSFAFYGCSSLVYNEHNNGKYLGNGENMHLVLVDVIDPSAADFTIPDTTRFIGEGAFYGCESLTSITIPNSVTSIGSSAFEGCTSLTSITIPDSVTSIGSSAFEGCTSLTSITIPDSVTSIGWSAFDGCSSLTSITIPDSVTSIGNFAFSGCSSLVYNEHNNGKYLGNSENLHLVLVDVIDRSATDFTIPDTTRIIGSSAFEGCTGLTSITIPDSVTSIGASAFYGCESLTSVYYTGTEEEWSQIDIDSYNNDHLIYATRYYYSETQPTAAGNYWHYVDGTPTPW